MVELRGLEPLTPNGCLYRPVDPVRHWMNEFSGQPSGSGCRRSGDRAREARIKGTRVTVQVILELLAAGETIDELLSEYDELTRDDVLAALEFAANVAGGAQVRSFVA